MNFVVMIITIFFLTMCIANIFINVWILVGGRQAVPMPLDLASEVLVFSFGIALYYVADKYIPGNIGYPLKPIPIVFGVMVFIDIISTGWCIWRERKTQIPKGEPEP